jgi:hypothetical protein
MDAYALAARLDLDLDAIGICLACLSIVSMELDSGDERAVRRALADVVPNLWGEGLALPVQAALEQAARAGDADAEAALVGVTGGGADSPVVHAIVRRLAQELSDRMRRDFERWFPKGQVVPLDRR